MKDYKISEIDMMPAVSARKEYAISPSAGTPREAMLDPNYWKHVARLLVDGTNRDWTMPAKIEAMPKDGKWYAEYRVLYADRFHAKVIETFFTELEAIDVEVSSEGYEVKYVSPTVRFCVVRKSDNELVIKNCQTRVDAEVELRRLEARLAA